MWSDGWASDAGWQRAVDDLKREKLVRAVGISVNRWQPTNVMRALATGLVDSVQVVYNVFDQAPKTSCSRTASSATSPSSRACHSTRAA